MTIKAQELQRLQIFYLDHSHQSTKAAAAIVSYAQGKCNHSFTVEVKGKWRCELCDAEVVA